MSYPFGSAIHGPRAARGIFPMNRSSPSRIVSGCGGQPGMYRSTGRVASTPLFTSGLSANGPPLIAQAPRAMTIFGLGTASYVSISAWCMLRGIGPVTSTVRMARSDELNPKTRQIPPHGVQHVGIEVARIAASGAHFAQTQRPPKDAKQVVAHSLGQFEFGTRQNQVPSAAGRQSIIRCVSDCALRARFDACRAEEAFAQIE